MARIEALDRDVHEQPLRPAPLPPHRIDPVAEVESVLRPSCAEATGVVEAKAQE
jgi:hypothetical protein